MTQTVKLPDGTTASFPDEMNQDDINNALKDHYTPREYDVAGEKITMTPDAYNKSVLSPDFTKEQLNDSASQARIAVESPFYNVIQGLSNVATKVSPDWYGNSDLRKQVIALEEERNKRMEETPLSGLADIGGLAVGTMGAGTLIKAASKAPEAVAAIEKAAPSLMDKIVGGSAVGVAGGEVGGATLPITNQNPEEANKQFNQNVMTGGEVGLGAHWFIKGLEGLNAAKNATVGFFNKFTKSGAEESATKDIGELVNNVPEAETKLNAATTEGNPNNLTVPEILQNPELATEQLKNESAVPFDVGGKEVNPKLAYETNRQVRNDNLASELSALNIENANPEAIGQAAKADVTAQQSKIDEELAAAKATSENASNNQQAQTALLVRQTPTEAQAAEQTGKLARDTVNAKTAEYNKAYNDIDPKGTIQAPNIVAKEEINTLIDNDKVGSYITGDKEAGIPADPELSNIVEKYTTNDTISVKQRIDDKNRINAYIADLYKQRSQNAGDTIIANRLSAAQEVKNALYKDINSLTDVQAANGGSVADKFNEAEAKYKAYQKDFLENPEQFRTTINPDTGEVTKYGFSESPFGEYDYRLRKGSAGGLAEEGKKILPVQNAGEFSTSLQNIKNIPESGKVVKDQILGTIRNNITDEEGALKAFDKVYTKDTEDALIKNGFKKEAAELRELRDNISKSKGTAEEQRALFETAQGNAKQAREELEKTTAFKLLDKNNDLKPLPPENQVDMMLENKQIQNDVIALAEKQADGGQAKAGLGQAVLDRIKQLSITSKEGVIPKEGNALYKQITDPVKFDSLLDKHEDFLRKTLGDNLFSQMKEQAQTARLFTYIKTVAGSTTKREAESEGTKLELAGIKGITQKVTKASYSALNAIFTALTRNQDKVYNATVYKILNDPQAAIEAQKAFNSVDKDPGAVLKFLSNISEKTVDIAPFIAGASSNPKQVVPKDKKLDNEVNDVLKSPKGGTDEKSKVPTITPNTPNTGKPVPVGKPQSNTSSTVAHDSYVADASKKTGMPVEYFKHISNAESKGESNPDTAKNPNSSATGRYQFTTKTWTQLRKKHPDLPEINAKSDPRTDDKWATLAVGYLGSDNKSELKRILGRAVTYSDIYGAHHFGLTGFTKLMSAPPGAVAANILPDAAAANTKVFYDTKGKVRSVRQVYKKLESMLD